MREGLDERAGQLDRVVKDYAWWNEAVEAIQLRQDRAWAEARLGSYLYGTHEYDWAFVIAPDGSTFFAALEGETVEDDITTALGNELWRPLVAAEPRGDRRATSRRPCTPTSRCATASSASPRRPRSWPRTSWPGAAAGRRALRAGGGAQPDAGLAGGARRLRLRPRTALSFGLPADATPPTGLQLAGPDGRTGRAARHPGRRAGRAPSIWWRCAPSLGVALLLFVAFGWSALRQSRILDPGHRRERGPLSRRRRRELGLDLRDRRRRAG